MSTSVTILGCGSSLGTPLIGNDWMACDPNEPRNRRTRPSIIIEHDGVALVIDTGPDFREQINRENIKRIDAVLYTHYHADHTTSMDDLRGWCRRHDIKMPVYAIPETLDILRVRFDYLIEQQMADLYPILINAYELKPSDLYTPIRLGGVPVTVIEQDHGTCTSLGVRIGNFAYSTDMLRLGDRAIETLRGIDTWVVDAAAYNRTPTVHADLETVYALNDKIGARQVYLTHMPPIMDYQTLLRELRPGYTPAHDGLKIDVAV